MPGLGCTYCGESHGPEARFCPATGAALTPPSNVTNPPGAGKTLAFGMAPLAPATVETPTSTEPPSALLAEPSDATLAEPISFLPDPGSAVPSVAEEVDPLAQTELASHASLLGELVLPPTKEPHPAANLTAPLPPSNRAPATREPGERLPVDARARLGASSPAPSATNQDRSSGRMSGPAADSASALGPDASQGLFSLLVEAGRIYRAHPLPVLGLTALFFVPGSALEALGRAWHQSLSVPAAGFPVARVGVGLGMAFLLQVTLALVLGALGILVAGREVDRARSWRRYPGWLIGSRPRVLLAVALAAAIAMAGIPLLIIPGLLLALLFGWVPAVTLFEGTPGKAALVRSARLVVAGPVRASLLFCLLGLVGFGADRLARAVLPGSGQLVIELVADLCALFVFPVPLLAATLLYFDLRRTDEGLGRPDRWTAFERLRDGTPR